MSYGLFLDDERVPSDVKWIAMPYDQDWVIVRSLAEFTDTINGFGIPEIVSFDHDLGKRPDGSLLETGMDCAKWLVDYCMDQNCTLPDFQVHSKNGPGGENIRGLLDGFKAHQRRSGFSV